MAKEIEWHPEAKEDFREILSYLLDKSTFEVAEKFTNQIDEMSQTLMK